MMNVMMKTQNLSGLLFPYLHAASNQRLEVVQAWEQGVDDVIVIAEKHDIIKIAQVES